MAVIITASIPAYAEGRGLLARLIERKHAQKEDVDDAQAPSSTEGLYLRGKGTSVTEKIGDREFIVYSPVGGVASGQKRPLLVVLHGGLGSGSQIQKYIGLEPFADRYHFYIAYLNGTKVARMLSSERQGWNAGDCCGLPQERNIDDVGYIQSAVQLISRKYAVDTARVYGTGHSNGAMMTYRMLCETDLYKGAAIYAGVLGLNVQSCPLARGKRILALHGENDDNLPAAGGYTKAGVNRKTNYHSQDYTANVFKRSGADYTHIMLPKAQHRPETINAALLATEGVTLPEKIVTFLGLDHP